ncbi:MAG: Mut7-C RNAse domain-containing protein [Methanosarcinales archaeon]
MKYNNSKEPLLFVVDGMLGKLTRWLRLLGYDTVYVIDHEIEGDGDDCLLKIAWEENRILISKDKALIREAELMGLRAFLIHSNKINEQLKEMRDHFNLNLEPDMIRCSMCNSTIRVVKPEELKLVEEKDYVYPSTLESGVDFWICDNCGKVYWEGGHWTNIMKTIEELKK